MSTDYHQLAIHALSDLDYLGVPIEKIHGMTDEVLEEVEQYQRNQSSYS